MVWTCASDVLGARDEKHPAIRHDVSHYVCCHCHIASGCNIKLTPVGVRIKHSDSTNAASRGHAYTQSNLDILCSPHVLIST